MIPTFVYIMTALIVIAMGLSITSEVIAARNEVLRRRVALERAHAARCRSLAVTR